MTTSFYMIDGDKPLLCKTLKEAQEKADKSDGISELTVIDIVDAFIEKINTDVFGAYRIVVRERIEDER